MGKIWIGIVGVGNCASALIQGIEYYGRKSEDEAIGFMHWDIGKISQVHLKFYILKTSNSKPSNVSPGFFIFSTCFLMETLVVAPMIYVLQE